MHCIRFPTARASAVGTAMSVMSRRRDPAAQMVGSAPPADELDYGGQWCTPCGDGRRCRTEGMTAMASGTSVGRAKKSVPSGRLVPLAAAADEFSVSVKTIRRRIADGSIRAYRIGRLIRVDLDEVRAGLLVPVSNAR